MLALGTLTLGALGVVAMHVSPARPADVRENLSMAWVHVLTAVHLRAGSGRAVRVVEPQVGTEPLTEPAPPPSGQSAIAYGDRLKVTFFESVSLALGDPAGTPGAPALGAIFPRMDLSGEYVVDDAGGIDIPRLGRFTATGHGVSTLEAQLANAFRRALGRPSDVHVAVLDRQPVYFLGGPRGGTTIKYAPGMIVLQAFAEAGGYQHGASDTSRAIETIRETQRLGETKDRLARALVRQARLIALRDGLPAGVSLPPATAARLADALPQDAVVALLNEADTTLGIERRAHAEQLVLADRLVHIAKDELAAQNLRVAQAQALAQSKAARLHDLEGIAARGSISQFKLADMAIEVAEIAAKQEDLHVAVAQAESRLAEAEIARAKVVQANTAQIALDIAAIGQEVSDLNRAVASMEAVVMILGDGQPAQSELKTGRPTLRIVRRGPGGMLLIPATEMTPLVPGDVLQITPAEPPAIQPASASAHS
jgi:polysaccharide biosynthesis/export protein ExoF